MRTRVFAIVASIGMLSGCEAPVQDESVRSLLANPERLKEVTRLCREDRQRVSEQTCINAAQARRERLMGDGETKYTPQDVEMFMVPVAP